MSRTSTLMAVVFLLASVPARAEEGRIPIFEPTVLDGSLGPISGKYVVTRNILPTGPSMHMIQILGTGSEEIEIDLNGFTVGGNDGGSGLFAVTATNIDKLTLRNGTLYSQVGNPGCLSASGSGQLIIEDVVMKGGGFSGLVASGWDDVLVRRNSFSAAGGTIEISGGSFRGMIEDNILRGGGQSGSPAVIYTSAPSEGLIVRRNRISAGGGGGIDVNNATGVLIDSNAVEGGAGVGYGLTDSDGCHVRNNSAVGTSNGTAGFRFDATADCLIVDNVARGYGGDGMGLIDSDRNHIERNVINGNGALFGSFGLHFNATSNDNTYGRNSAAGNAGGQPCPTSPNPACGAPDLCDQGTNNKTFGDNLVPGPPPC